MITHNEYTLFISKTASGNFIFKIRHTKLDEQEFLLTSSKTKEMCLEILTLLFPKSEAVKEK